MSNDTNESFKHRDIILFNIPYGDNPEDTASELKEIIEKRVAEINPSYELGDLMMIDIPKNTPRYASTCNVFICFEKSFRNGAIVSDLNGSIRFRGKSIGVELCDNFADHSCRYTGCTWSRVKNETQSRARSSTLTASPLNAFMNSSSQASSPLQTSSLAQASTASRFATPSRPQVRFNSSYTKKEFEDELYEVKRENATLKRKIEKLERELNEKSAMLDNVKLVVRDY